MISTVLILESIVSFVGIIITLLLAYVAIFILMKLTLRGVKISINKNNRMTKAKKITMYSIIKDLIRYITTIIIIVVTLLLIGIDSTVLIASLGAVTVVLGIAGQELIRDMINGIFNIYEGYYDVGDYILVGDYEGEVISFGIKSTVLKSLNNEEITLPNSYISQIINYSRDNYHYFLDFSISYNQNVIDIEGILSEGFYSKLEEHKDIQKVIYKGIQELGESSVDFRLEVICIAEERFDVRRFVNREIKLLFDHHEIEIPFNQLVIHNGEKNEIEL